MSRQPLGLARKVAPVVRELHIHNTFPRDGMSQQVKVAPYRLPGNISYEHPPRTASFYYVHATLIMMFGNYFTELASWVKQITVYRRALWQVFLSVVGWKALRLTLPQDPRPLSEARTTILALILAKRPSFFHWDEVSQVV
jgi:hypothetical protein